MSEARAARNNPPRFVTERDQTEIVLRLKEGPETPVGEYFSLFFLPRRSEGVLSQVVLFCPRRVVGFPVRGLIGAVFITVLWIFQMEFGIAEMK